MIGTAVRCAKRGLRRPVLWTRGQLAVLAFYWALTGCASLPAGGGAAADDPLEPFNRAVFDANLRLDDALIRPLAEAYRSAVPAFVRDRIRAAIDNLAEPRIFANDLLQRRAEAAGITFARLAINTTLGVGGLFDVATEKGFSRQSGDFGQTLYTWGVADGPYLVLLFFGPSNFRDAVGLGVDLVTTPPALVVTGHVGTLVNIGVGTVDGMDLRSRNIESFDEIKASALDLYAYLKSVTRQRRAAQLREATGAKEEEPPELLDPAAAGHAAPKPP